MLCNVTSCNAISVHMHSYITHTYFIYIIVISLEECASANLGWHWMYCIKIHTWTYMNHIQCVISHDRQRLKGRRALHLHCFWARSLQWRPCHGFTSLLELSNQGGDLPRFWHVVTWCWTTVNCKYIKPNLWELYSNLFEIMLGGL